MNTTKRLLGIGSCINRAWLTALLATLMSGTALAEDVSTRFGTLSINADQKLLYKGKLVDMPSGDPISVVERYQLTGLDLIIFQQTAGSACPAQFFFATTSPAGLKMSDTFGTCNDQIRLHRSVTDSVAITMPGFVGPFSSEQEKNRAADERHIYTFREGGVYANGKPIPFGTAGLKQDTETPRQEAGADGPADEKRKYLARLAIKHAPAIKALGFSAAFLDGTIYLQADYVNPPIAYGKFRDWLALLFESGHYSNITKISSDQAQGILLKRPGMQSGGLLFVLDGGDIFPSHLVTATKTMRAKTIDDQYTLAMMVSQAVK